MNQGREVVRIQGQGLGMVADGGGVHLAFDAAKQVAWTGQLGQAIHHHADVAGPLRHDPGGRVVQQRIPGVGQDDAVAAVGIGTAGQAEAAELAE